MRWTRQPRLQGSGKHAFISSRPHVRPEWIPPEHLCRFVFSPTEGNTNFGRYKVRQQKLRIRNLKNISVSIFKIFPRRNVSHRSQVIDTLGASGNSNSGPVVYLCLQSPPYPAVPAACSSSPPLPPPHPPLPRTRHSPGGTIIPVVHVIHEGTWLLQWLKTLGTRRLRAFGTLSRCGCFFGTAIFVIFTKNYKYWILI